MNKTKDLEAVLYKDKKISVAFLSEVYIFLPTKSILGSVLTESSTFLLFIMVSVASQPSPADLAGERACYSNFLKTVQNSIKIYEPQLGQNLLCLLWASLHIDHHPAFSCGYSRSLLRKDRRRWRRFLIIKGAAFHLEEKNWNSFMVKLNI